MSLDIVNGVPVVRLRAFRAIDDPETCLKFLKGHEDVLAHIGVKKVTSSKSEWMHNPAAFVVIVESLDKASVYGGMRLHVAGGTEPLPIEEATAAIDPKIHDLVKKYARYGTGETCGLWNSWEIAGYGIGSVFMVRTGVVIGRVIGIKSIFSLCAPYTVKMSEDMGCLHNREVGDNGTFYYPKEDLIATVMIQNDIHDLSTASEESRQAIEYLSANLNSVRTEELRKKKIKIHYELDLPNLKNWDLQAVIENALQKEYNIDGSLKEPPASFFQ